MERLPYRPTVAKCHILFLMLAIPTAFSLSESLFHTSVYDTIQSGHIAIVPEFMTPHDLEVLRRDAQGLYCDGHFTTDALASYGTTDGSVFDASKDRAVLKRQNWQNPKIGNLAVRQSLEVRVQDLRQDLAIHLNRPKLLVGDSVSKFGNGSTEISYTRFGPGAFLKKHVDEHHEELKGTAGWAQPTRRSLSWLIYLNENWNANRDGGCLRCYERGPVSQAVGARPNGDLQIGWLSATLNDPLERPVFLDSSLQHECRMYIGEEKEYITETFPAQPTLFVAGGEAIFQKFLITRRDLASRFHFIEPPKSLASQFLERKKSDGTSYHDVPPLSGTLVVFDSVTLPHEVLPTVSRERWACSGWMHEDQQEVHPIYQA